MQNPDPRNLSRRPLSLSGHAKCKERGAKSKDRDFFLHVFFSVWIHLSLDT
jgi:hypothetical protein